MNKFILTVISALILTLASLSSFATTTTVVDIDALIDIDNPVSNDVCFVTDLNRGGLFIYDSTQSAVNNNGTIFNGWKRQYSGAANVKWFGAEGDGSTDDSDAFQDAFDSEASVIEVPNVDLYYKIKNLTLPAGKTLRGIGRERIYNPYSVADMEGSCCLIYDTTGTSFITFGGNNTIEYINFYGVNVSVPAIANNSGGNLKFNNVSSCKFSVGLGNTNYYTRTTWVQNCHVAQNTIGMGGFIDSHIQGCEINANGIGVYQPAGANDSQFIENKVEWNTSAGYKFYANTNCSIIGGVIDRNYRTGIEVTSSSVNITGCVLRRNGKTNSTTGSHIETESSAVYVSNIITHTGADDGGGTVTPKYTFYATGSTNTLYVSNSDLTGNTTAVKNTNNGVLSFSNNLGINDTINGIATGTATISTGGTTSFNTTVNNLDTIGNYSIGTTYNVDVLVRNTSWGCYNGRFIIVLKREGGGAFVGNSINVFNTSTIALSNGSVMNVTFANIAADGSSFDVVCTATGGASYQTQVKVTKGNI